MDDDEQPGQPDHGEPAESDDAALESNDEIADEFTEDLDGLSMDDLGAAYARVAAEHDPEAFAQPEEAVPEDDTSETEITDEEQEDSSEDEALVTPEAIVEAALFVGHPENKRFTEQRLASLMRDVSPEEVVLLIDQLNESYKEADQGLRIMRDEQGYRMSIAPEVEAVRRSFWARSERHGSAKPQSRYFRWWRITRHHRPESSGSTRTRKWPPTEPTCETSIVANGTNQTTRGWTCHSSLSPHRTISYFCSGSRRSKIYLRSTKPSASYSRKQQPRETPASDCTGLRSHRQRINRQRIDRQRTNRQRTNRQTDRQRTDRWDTNDRPIARTPPSF